MHGPIGFLRWLMRHSAATFHNTEHFPVRDVPPIHLYRSIIPLPCVTRSAHLSFHQQVYPQHTFRDSLPSLAPPFLNPFIIDSYNNTGASATPCVRLLLTLPFSFTSAVASLFWDLSTLLGTLLRRSLYLIQAQLPLPGHKNLRRYCTNLPSFSPPFRNISSLRLRRLLLSTSSDNSLPSSFLFS